jgi:putative Mn2+ efflux pump MntP
MKDKKQLVTLISSLILLIVGIILITQIAKASKTDTDKRSSKAQGQNVTSLSVQVASTSMAMQQGGVGAPLYFPVPVVSKTPMVGAKNGQPTPTTGAKNGQPTPPTPPGQSTPGSTVPAPTSPPPTSPPPVSPPNPSGSTPYRYFPVGTALSTIQSQGAALSKQQVKLLIEKEIDGSWGVIQQDLGFSTKEKAYAFFLGMASRESTLQVGVETGSGPSHSYGALQAAEPSYNDPGANYAPEDVPEMTQFDFTPENFYDPGISIYMGMRHLIHFSKQATTAGFTGTQWLRHTLIGYNTGVVTFSNESWIQQYSDEIGALAGWYLLNGHLYDTQFTYTGDPNVDRNQPWGWY